MPAPNSLKKLVKWQPVLHWMGLLLLTLAAVYLPYSKRGAVSAESKAWSRNLENRTGFKVMQAANELRPKSGNKIVQIGYENAVYFLTV